MKTKQSLLLGSVLLATVTASPAATVFATLNSQDTIVGERQSLSPALGYYENSASLPVGVTGGTNARTNYNSILGFILPTLSPGESITAATFRITVESQNNSTGSSLFGLSTTNPNTGDTTAPIDFFSESNSGTGLIDAVFTGAAPAAASEPTADALAFVQSFYTGLAPSQSEIFFRINASSDSGTTVRRVNFSANTAQLELTIIPEPSAALIGTLGLLLLLRRRR